jgi:replicative DNA helicase
MLLDNEIIAEVLECGITEGDFYLQPHATIFKHQRKVWEETGICELVQLVESLRAAGELEGVGGYEVVAALEQHVFTTGAAPEHARIVQEKANLRRLAKVGSALIADAVSERFEASNVTEHAMKQLLDVETGNARAQWSTPQQVAPEVLAAIERTMQHGGPFGIRTFLDGVDQVLVTMAPRDLIILGARPSVGKTAFGLEVILNNARAGLPVGIFSMEMGRDQLLLRMACSIAGVSLWKVRLGTINPVELGKIRNALSYLQGLPIHINDQVGLSVTQLRAQAMRMHARHRLALIVVDYLQLMEGENTRGRSTNVIVNQQSRGLKKLAGELLLPVMALSQLSRDSEKENRKPRLSDLRDSGGIEQDADTVLFLHRDKNPEAEERAREAAASGQYIPAEQRASITEVLIAKNRQGPIGVRKVLYFTDAQQWRDYPEGSSNHG